MNDLVTVVMPVYNQEEYVKWAIKSVLGQNYKNWEMIIVDDGSVDGTRTILAHYEETYPNRIHVYQNVVNRGVAYTLNKAISHAKGGYICWLSSDDMYLDTMLSSSIEFLTQHEEYDAVFSKYAFINERNDVISMCGEEIYADCLREDSTLVYEQLLKYGNFFNGCSLFAKADVFFRTGKFSERYRYAQDYHYWFRLAAQNRIGFVDEYNVLSRIHAKQGTREGNNDIDAIHVFVELVKNEEIVGGLCRKAGMEYTRETLSLCFITRIMNYFQMGMVKELQEIVKCYSEWLNNHC